MAACPDANVQDNSPHQDGNNIHIERLYLENRELGPSNSSSRDLHVRMLQHQEVHAMGVLNRHLYGNRF